MSKSVNRKNISPKLRYSVFERDGFICKYCGRSPQTHECVLQADHIISVKNGSTNDIDNLITSCWDCNIGKGAKTANLPIIPDKEIELKLVLERLEQVRALNDYQVKINKANENIKQEKYKIVNYLLTGFTEELKESVRKVFDTYTKHLSINDISEAIIITRNKKFEYVNDFTSYLVGILRNKKIEKEDPENLKFNKTVNYFYGKAKRYFGWQADRDTISDIVDNYKTGYIEEQLETATSWTRFCINLPIAND